MTIYRTQKTENFNQINNDLVNSTLDPIAKAILFYLLGKPENWNLNTSDLKKRLGLTYYKIKKGIKILKKLGYIVMKRLCTGFCLWHVYETPITPSQQQHNPTQTRVISPSVENPPVVFEPIKNTEIVVNNTETTTPAQQAIIETVQQENVVVSFELEQSEPANSIVIASEQQPDNSIIEQPAMQWEAPYYRVTIIIPESIPEPLKPVARKAVMGLDTAVIALLTAVFNEAVKKGNLSNPIGYFLSLVKAAKAGTLTAPAQKQPIIEPIEVRLQKQRDAEIARDKAASAVNNLQYYKDLYKRYGKNVVAHIPAQYKAELGIA